MCESFRLASSYDTDNGKRETGCVVEDGAHNLLVSRPLSALQNGIVRDGWTPH